MGRSSRKVGLPQACTSARLVQGYGRAGLPRMAGKSLDKHTGQGR